MGAPPPPASVNESCGDRVARDRTCSRSWGCRSADSDSLLRLRPSPTPPPSHPASSSPPSAAATGVGRRSSSIGPKATPSRAVAVSPDVVVVLLLLSAKSRRSRTSGDDDADRATNNSTSGQMIAAASTSNACIDGRRARGAVTSFVLVIVVAHGLLHVIIRYVRRDPLLIENRVGRS